MNWLILLAIAGFVLLLGVAVFFFILPIRLDNRTPFTMTNCWITALFCAGGAVAYFVTVLAELGNIETGLLLGNMLICVTGTLVGATGVFLQGPLRDYYAKSWMSLAESQTKNDEKKKDE